MANIDRTLPSADRSTLNQASQLLSENERVPAKVTEVELWAAKKEFWYLLSRNKEAFWCWHAAKLRWCLGQQGIPPERELKTNSGYYIDGDSKKHRVAIHCRGDRKLDLTSVNKLLGGNKFTREENPDLIDAINGEHVDLEELRKTEFGLINPFSLEASNREQESIIHVFDQDLLSHVLLPRTVMTNAGDRTWGIEFRVDELIASLPKDRVIIGDVTVGNDRPKRPVIGILTGNGPESGSLLWKVINDRVRDRRSPFSGDAYLPRVVVRSLPAMGLTMELHLRLEQAWAEISREIESICGQLNEINSESENILTIACNTTPFFGEKIKELCSQYGVKFISIVDAIEMHLRKNSINSFTLYGIGYVHNEEFSGYKRFHENPSIVVNELSTMTIERIDRLAYDVKRGEDMTKCANQLRDIITHNTTGPEETAIIALTELSVIMEQRRSVFDKWLRQGKIECDIIDTIAVYGDLIASFYVDPPTGELKSQKASVAASS